MTDRLLEITMLAWIAIYGGCFIYRWRKIKRNVPDGEKLIDAYVKMCYNKARGRRL